MKARTLLVSTLLFLLAAGLACREPTAAGVEWKNKKFTGTAFVSSGPDFELIVDTRAARIAGAAEFLPLQVALRNKGEADLAVSRESFILENLSGVKLPALPYAEFEDSYPRHRVDLRVGRDFLESLNGRYPSPPFTKRGLDFFPLKESGVVPREEITLRQGHMAIGFIYFRLPDLETLAEEGRCKILFTPSGSDEQFVVELIAYKAGGKA